MTKLLLWDMDGTLSNDGHRKDLYLNKQYLEYFSYDAQMADTVYPEARALYNEMKADGWVMGYLTARLERNRPATTDWLTLHGFDSPETAILRPEADHIVRPPRFKAVVIGDIIEHGGYDQVVMVDNDPLVVERIAADYGDEFVFHADWDQHPETASIQNFILPELA